MKAQKGLGVKIGNTDNSRTHSMAGVKRSAAVMAEDLTMNESSQFLSIFEGFKAELDEHHDRRERIIKAGRDVTAGSKKIIFALQR